MTLSNEDFNQVIDHITDMDLDQLRRLIPVINTTLKVERAREANRTAAKLTVGIRVRVTDDVKPRYLARQTGTVVEMVNGRPLVELDCGPLHKFRSGRVHFRSASALEVI